MKVHEVFPIVVAQDELDVHQEFKNRYFEELKTLWFNGYENETPENSGRCALHLNPNYKVFFESLKRSVVKYKTSVQQLKNMLDEHETRLYSIENDILNMEKN